MFDLKHIHIEETDYIAKHDAECVGANQYFNALGETIFRYFDHCVVGDYE